MTDLHSGISMMRCWRWPWPIRRPIRHQPALAWSAISANCLARGAYSSKLARTGVGIAGAGMPVR